MRWLLVDVVDSGFPGYYYDPKQDNYYKTPNYWDARLLENVPNEMNNVHLRECALNKLKAKLNKQRSQNIVQELRNIAISKHPIKSDLFKKLHMKVLQHKQHLSFSYPIIRPAVVESDSARILHIISSRMLLCELRRYEVQWTRGESRSNHSGFKIIDTIHRSQDRYFHSCMDAMLDPSTNNIICLSPRRLVSVRYDGNIGDYQLLQTVDLPRKYSDSVFPRRALRSYASSVESLLERGEDSVIMFYNRRTISSLGPRLVPLLTLSELRKMPHVSLSKYLPHASFTAMGNACCAGTTRRLDAYVSVGKAFSLLSFTSARRERELISFGDVSASRITHLQCLLSADNKRSGIIVGRVDGSVELWDDRQPRRAAVTYKESKEVVKSGIPPNPVVDCPSHSFVATAMEKYGAIGVWQLQTGELMDVLECPGWAENSLLLCKPPQLVIHSHWGLGNGKSSPFGPVLIAIYDRFADFFY
ncbi:unnamed protein product [Hydatigera taeniaeformis]|uniref:Uncharacterized protein n=1 Tax=Hydatigena taeniaeformis TaxID=6205 RepID=A0A3P7FNS5_HYDTA|nr:unnamed protein product [Hydatigera taeniaeformis]